METDADGGKKIYQRGATGGKIMYDENGDLFLIAMDQGDIPNDEKKRDHWWLLSEPIP